MQVSSVEIASVILLIVFSGALAGVFAGQRLPSHHERRKQGRGFRLHGGGRNHDGAGVGLLISSANTSFRGRNADVARLSLDIVRLDELLRRYGAEADAIRGSLQGFAAMKFQDLFSNGVAMKRNVDNPATDKVLDDVQDRILALKPAGERERWLSAQALQLSAEIGEARASLIRQNLSSLPLPFLGAVVLWLTVLFASFGLFAPRNVTVVVALFLCALAV